MRGVALLMGLLWVVGACAKPTSEVEAVLTQLGSEVEQRLRARFELAGVTYPPRRVQLIAFKESRRLELWSYQDSAWRFIHDYAVFAASGGTGPKLREGDRQVPEGFYRIVALNPNSHFHLSMKLNYPNAYDWIQANKEGRGAPGSNIFIHGSAWSAGCLAVGNRYIEELFYLVARVGMDRSAVLIAPYDFRAGEAAARTTEGPQWLEELYAYLRLRLARFPLAQKQRLCPPGCRGSNARRKAVPDEVR
ncbi:MAG: L,D-transpeptidase family protein [Candidatus Thiodiazotropha sp. (ex Epidulcina cf. delphinae)]|nr:L,D-transpeptidase family protein [Candidatus Thiodiazotropha sp. (ex Epidulcina cf. delphinae)]